jgi:hypothetical protein
MIERRMIAPPNLQFFISDPDAVDVPVQGESIRIISSGECISVPCRFRDEGDTELIVGDNEAALPEAPQFDGTIPTPSGSVLFSDVEMTELLSFPAPAGTTRIRIWTDGSIFPDRIVVAIGG